MLQGRCRISLDWSMECAWGWAQYRFHLPSSHHLFDLHTVENSNFMFTFSKLLQSWPPKLTIVGIVVAHPPLHLWCTWLENFVADGVCMWPLTSFCFCLVFLSNQLSWQYMLLCIQTCCETTWKLCKPVRSPVHSPGFSQASTTFEFITITTPNKTIVEPLQKGTPEMRTPP